MERQYSIADTFINGHTRSFLVVFRLHAYEEADIIMHDIADRSGDAPIAKRALKTLAKGYQKRKKYIEAYDVWAEISSTWPTGELGKVVLAVIVIPGSTGRIFLPFTLRCSTVSRSVVVMSMT